MPSYTPARCISSRTRRCNVRTTPQPGRHPLSREPAASSLGTSRSNSSSPSVGQHSPVAGQRCGRAPQLPKQPRSTSSSAPSRIGRAHRARVPAGKHQHQPQVRVHQNHPAGQREGQADLATARGPLRRRQEARSRRDCLLGDHPVVPPSPGPAPAPHVGTYPVTTRASSCRRRRTWCPPPAAVGVPLRDRLIPRHQVDHVPDRASVEGTAAFELEQRGKFGLSKAAFPLALGDRPADTEFGGVAASLFSNFAWRLPAATGRAAAAGPSPGWKGCRARPRARPACWGSRSSVRHAQSFASSMLRSRSFSPPSSCCRTAS